MKPNVARITSAFTEELKCAICLELFQDPVLVQCGHSFCRICIDRVCGGKVCGSCPVCRVEFLRGRHTAIMALASLVERVKHQPVPSTAQQCEDHQEELTLYCKECESPACIICQDALKHSGHCFLPVQDAASMYKNRLTASLDQVNSRLKRFQEKQKDQAKAIRYIKWETLDAKSSISSLFERLHQTLKAQEMEMVKEVLAQEEKARREASERLTRQREDCQLILNTLLQEQDPLDFLQDIHSRLKKISTLIAPVVSIDRHQRTSSGPVEYTIWKQLKCAIGPTPCRLTLDPETAHSALVLSEDRTSVQCSSVDRRLPPHPKRFLKSLAVLGSEGFTSGRHYWEVDVGKASAWVLGVAEESISRQGNVELIPWNGVWAIQRKGGDTYEALERKPRTLSLTSMPQRIGVYVDTKEKQISFYNADDMCHMHTFHFFRSVELFPYFCHCANTSKEKPAILTICY
ncbi:zinc-binding protein A33-like [Ambystoma mexicanum]|uniref:zinc-binding protein A33-like n=1 Tax=Ambystoma mexicanum TaxID=8296 RepID=UPI0037E8DB4D